MDTACPVHFLRVPESGPEVLLHAITFANLQEFSQRIGLICALHASGHLSATAAYAQVDDLWQELRRASQTLQTQE